MEKVMIVGASGLLGNRMAELYAGDYEVYGTHNDPEPASRSFYKLDATRKREVISFMRKMRPDFVVDAHGLTSVDYCETHKAQAFKVNVTGTKNVAEAAKALGCGFILISTSGVFDGNKETAYTERDKPRPINYYGVTKLLAERAVRSLSKSSIIARTTMLFGSGGSRKIPSFAKWVVSELRSGHRVSAVTDQYTNPTFTDNLAWLVKKLHERDANGTFHTAGKDTVNRFEFARKIAEEFGFDKNLVAPVTTAELKQGAKRPLRLSLDISKTEKATGMKGMRIGEAIRAFKQSLI